MKEDLVNSVAQIYNCGHAECADRLLESFTPESLTLLASLPDKLVSTPGHVVARLHARRLLVRELMSLQIILVF